MSGYRRISDAPLACGEGRFMTRCRHSDSLRLGSDLPSTWIRPWSRLPPKAEIAQEITDWRVPLQSGSAWSAYIGGKVDPSRLLKKYLISVYCRVPARYRGPSRSFGRGVWGRFLNSDQRAEEIATKNANQNQARPRQPNVLPIFGQLEAQSGKSQIRCENLLSSSKVCCASYTLCVA